MIQEIKQELTQQNQTTIKDNFHNNDLYNEMDPNYKT